MTNKRIEQALAKHGFAYDESVTGRDGTWGYWSGTIDPIGPYSIGGECRGICVYGNTRAEMDAEALAEAEVAHDHLEACTDPACEFHNPD